MAKAKYIVIGLTILWDMLVVFAWNRISPWVPRPPQGYIWEVVPPEWIWTHYPDGWTVTGINEPIAIAQEKIREREQVWVPVNTVDPITKQPKEVWMWVTEPYE